jgi:hypothetical protein
MVSNQIIHGLKIKSLCCSLTQASLSADAILHPRASTHTSSPHERKLKEVLATQSQEHWHVCTNVFRTNFENIGHQQKKYRTYRTKAKKNTGHTGQKQKIQDNTGHF